LKIFCIIKLSFTEKVFLFHSCSTQHFALNDNGEESKAASHPSENSLHDEVLKQHVHVFYVGSGETIAHDIQYRIITY